LACQPPSTASRRRGAPRANRNALKHGFYAKGLVKADLKDLETCQFEDLKDEIAMLRVYIRYVLELAGKLATLDDALDVVGTLSAWLPSVSPVSSAPMPSSPVTPTMPIPFSAKPSRR
jgi:hypothetical protein